MYSPTILAVAGLVSLVAAVPYAQPHHHHLHHKRDFVWETVTEEIIQIIPVTKTIWLEPGETAPAQPQAPVPDESSSNVQAAAFTPSSTPSTLSTPISQVQSVQAPSSVMPVPSTTSSVYVAPSPSSTYVAPASSAAQTSSYVAPPPSSSASAPTVVAGGGGSADGDGLTYGLGASGTSYTGDLTSYTPGLGACGETDTAAEAVVAINAPIFDSYNTGNPNNNPLCGKTVTITGANGEKYQAKIVDRCPVCEMGDLDLATDFFTQVTGLVDDRVHGVQWSFD